ncbi:MAG TPA: SRPBCC family protein [Solirubrobacterales bacterium]|nr:SRPBCC family protein [Solirubrobacterales bacterium]
MGPVSAEVEMDAPRERVFETIADLARRPSFTDHFLTEFRLTRIESSGVGAGARFRFDLPLRGIWMDTAIVELASPHRIVERGRGGRVNRIPSNTVWEVLEGSGSLTRVRVAYWTEPSHPLDRALDALGGASIWQERGWREALRRLRDQLEAGVTPEPSLAVAGGNPHATGIP